MDSQRKRGPSKSRQQMDDNNGETNKHKQKRWKQWPNLFNRRVLFSSIEHLSTTCIRSPLPSSSLKDAFFFIFFLFVKLSSEKGLTWAAKADRKFLRKATQRWRDCGACERLPAMDVWMDILMVFWQYCYVWLLYLLRKPLKCCRININLWYPNCCRRDVKETSTGWRKT